MDKKTKVHSSQPARSYGTLPMVRIKQSARLVTDSKSGVDVISFQEIISREARDFLLQAPTHDNRFAFYRLIEKVDPEIKISKNYLALMIQRSYLGPRLDDSDKTYQPSEGFLSNVNLILAEWRFASLIGTIAKDLISYGNSFVRFGRNPEVKEEGGSLAKDKTIVSSEIIPPDSVTILSDRCISDPKGFKGIINSADYYVISEKKSRGDKPYDITWDSSTPESKDDDGLPPEIVLPDRDVLQVTWDREGNQFQDSFNRSTYNIWGSSTYENLLIYVKGKLTLITDYLRWIRSGMPRWVLSAALGDVLDLNNYEGSSEERIKAATEASQKIFQRFEDQLYRMDTNEYSPNYGKKMVMEPDEIITLSDDVTFEQKGGSNMPDSSVLNFIKECNRAIASAMGVPMTLFGYQEGNTFATSKITSKFMAGYGGGLLRSIEVDVKEKLKSEFEYRDLPFTPNDFENLYSEYDRDDYEALTAIAAVQLSQAQVIVQLATAANALYTGGIFTLNEARTLIKDGPDALKNLTIRSDGDSLKPLQPMIPAGGGFFVPPPSTVHHSTEDKTHDDLESKLTLDKHEPEMQDGVKSAITDSFVYFIESIAKKVEKGEARGLPEGS